MKIETEEFGTPEPLTVSPQLVVYRIIQESLTNVLKHSGTQPAAVVTFNWEGPGLALSVTSTGDRPPADQTTGTGGPHYGVRNMKDRAHLAGGWLTAGPDDGTDPGYVVTAYIPTLEQTSPPGKGGPDDVEGEDEVAA